MLRDRGLAQDTLLLYTADNSPESQWIGAGGDNPGSTGGLGGFPRLRSSLRGTTRGGVTNGHAAHGRAYTVEGRGRSDGGRRPFFREKKRPLRAKKKGS